VTLSLTSRLVTKLSCPEPRLTTLLPEGRGVLDPLLRLGSQRLRVATGLRRNQLVLRLGFWGGGAVEACTGGLADVLSDAHVEVVGSPLEP
jgi:hypothetical protein